MWVRVPREALRTIARSGKSMRAVDVARATGLPVERVRYGLRSALRLGLARQPWPGKFELVPEAWEVVLHG